MHDLLVIGAGLAGLAAARHAASAGANTVIVETQPLYGGLVANVEHVDGLSDAAGEPTSGMMLAMERLEAAMEQGAELLEAEVLGLAPGTGGFAVTTSAGSRPARAVLVATGGKLRKLDVPGEDAFYGRGVSQCADCDGPMFQDEDVLVVGGGDAAAQEALVLAEFCRSVTVLARSGLKAQPRYAERLAALPNIRLLRDRAVDAILGDATVTAVRLRAPTTGAVEDFACTGVFPFIGTEPAANFLPAAVVRRNGLVETDDDLMTTLPGLYAAGAARLGYSGRLADAAAEGEAAARAALAFIAR
ncbi:MAG: NAD(P)/FAD-dependent oxidoreductase [Alphaproteobacteria bacterium]